MSLAIRKKCDFKKIKKSIANVKSTLHSLHTDTVAIAIE